MGTLLLLVGITLIIIGIIGLNLKPNDWVPVYTSTETYEVSQILNGLKIPGSTEKESVSILYYSKSRNKYKIKESGYIISTGLKSSLAYQRCIQKQISLQNK